jgi:ribosomal protein S18 acetylase RimI-like enzyme
VVHRSVGLSPSTLEAIAGLERRVVAADGGRLKLEWNALHHRAGRDVKDLLWWGDRRLLGFLGIYSHSAPVLELAGMVDPEFRRRGIGTALLDEALHVCGERAHTATLLVVPRMSVAGRALALRRGGTLDHSEHALRLLGQPSDVRADPLVTIRAATPQDLPAVDELLNLGFGWRPTAPDDAGNDGPASVDPNILVVERQNALIGTVRLIREGDTAGVYGFVIHPDHQGRGIGRDVLHRLCLAARAGGAKSVNLEVATDNDRALNLYTSLGFTQVTTEDYYALPDRRPLRSAVAA